MGKEGGVLTVILDIIGETGFHIAWNWKNTNKFT